MPGLIHKNCQLILGRVILKAPLGVWGKTKYEFMTHSTHHSALLPPIAFHTFLYNACLQQ
jgi:hypothetical protein